MRIFTGVHMKKLIAGTVLALLSGTVFAFDQSTISPNGGVSSYTKTDYIITSKFGDYFRSPSVKYVHMFNTNGLETECISYSAKDVLIDRIMYDYDTSRNLVSSRFYNASDELQWKTQVEYDSTGKIKEEAEYDASGRLTAKTIYRYNGRETSESLYNGEGALLSRTIKKTNELNRLVEVNKYFDDGSLDVQEVYGYADNGHLVQVEYFDAHKECTGKTIFRYDSAGVLTEEQQLNATKLLVARKIYKSDSMGNPTKVSLYSVAEKFGSIANELQGITEYSYKY